MLVGREGEIVFTLAMFPNKVSVVIIYFLMA